MSGAILTPYITLGEYSGEIIISVPITNDGDAADVTVVMYVYYAGRFGWPLHGDLIAEYEKDVHFGAGETKEVEFTHTVVPSGFGQEASRDVGIEVIKEGEVAGSAEFDDVYSAPGGGIIEPVMEPMMAMMMMAVMFMMIGPMIGGIT